MKVNRSTEVAISMVVLLCWTGAAIAPAKVAVDPAMLKAGGDHHENEILAWERLRAERQVILAQDESAPIVSQDVGGRIFAATASGKLLISENQGETFGEPAAIAVEGKPILEVQAMGVLTSGVLLIAYGTEGRLSIARSQDLGKSWQAVSDFRAEGYERVETGQSVRMVERADGTVLLPLVGWKDGSKEKREGVIYATRDLGRSWTKVGVLGERCRGANLLQLRSGALLAAVTYQGSRQEGDPMPGVERKELFHNVVIARSADGGKTWSDYRCVTRYKEAPADLVELSTGSIVLTYGEQNFPSGARAIVSKDGGRTWSRTVYILGLSTVWAEWYAGTMFSTEPGWRVSSLALANEVILTLYTRGAFELSKSSSAWYKQHGTLGEKGKAVLALRWTLEGMKKTPMSFPGFIPSRVNAEGYLDNGRCRIKPEHLHEGGDYLYQDEILRYQRIPAEHQTIGPGKKGPIVCLDPSGNPVVADAAGHVYRSTDQGHSWKQISTVTPVIGYIQSFGILHDGTMLAADARWPEPLHVLRSEDGGKSWGEPIRVDPKPFDRNGGANSMRIIQIPDGTVLMPAGTLTHKVRYKSIAWDGIYRSRDAGKTWDNFSYIGVRCSESNILRLKSGRMLVATRSQGPPMSDDFIHLDDTGYRPYPVKNVFLARSENDGYTWSSSWSVTRWSESTGDLVEMRDGTIVLSYQQKNAPTGSRAMVSRDEGKTWDSRVYMLGWWPDSGGMTSSVLLKEGAILTVNTDGSHLHATIWKPPSPES